MNTVPLFSFMTMTLREKYFGDKAFYKMVLAIALPVLLQNGITNFVNLLDNIMVGRVGTDAVSAVSIIGQFFFVFNITIFGGVSGASIFGAQFYGNGDNEGLRDTFRFRLLACVLLTIVALAVLILFSRPLISLYLHEGESTGNVANTLALAEDYLRIMLIGFPPFALSLCYASTLRDMGQTRVPMRAAFLAVLVNLVLNYLLIFGKFGFPRLGVAGAAVATVISRYVECTVILLWTHGNQDVCPFIIGAYKSFKVPAALCRSIFKCGIPLLSNEILWAGGMATLAQCYSMRGLDVVASYSIANTVMNLFNISFIALGSSIAIIIGNLLGAGKMEEARQRDTQMIVFSVLVTAAFGLVMALFAPFFPLLYNTTQEVRVLARDIIWITALYMPMHAFMHAAYFTLRSGGKTIITFLFDSGFMWVLSIPVAFFLSRYTSLPMRPMYAIVLAVEMIKCVVGFFFLKSDMWLNNLVRNNE